MSRPRLTRQLGRCWDVPLTVLTAPGGSGKTTLLAGYAQEVGRPRRIAWYQADRATRDGQGLVVHLGEVFGSSIPELAERAPAGSLAELLAAMKGVDGPPHLLIVDDAHVLAGSAAERVLVELVEHLPPWMHVLFAGRQPFRLDISKLRVNDEVLEFGAEDLRFRSWEVEELFRRHHGHELPAEEVADLTRKTSGWAAGLHLFHLAIRGKTPEQRRQILVGLPTGLRHHRDFLTRHVLDDLSATTRDFLVGTSVLGVLRGPWCDRLLGRTGSAEILADLADRHFFLTTTDDVTYRMHEVLRAHLERTLFERLGEDDARRWCGRAAAILEMEGAFGDAWRNYCRAQDWDAAGELLARFGTDVINPSAPWWDPLLDLGVGDDAWAHLAQARRQVLAGRWREAVESFRMGEEVAGEVGFAEVCRRERLLLEGWVDPTSAAPTGWSGALRRAMAGDLEAPPSGQHVEPVDQLVLAISAFLSGHLTTAWSLVADGLGTPSAPVGQWAQLIAGMSGTLLGRREARWTLPATAGHLESALPAWMSGVLGVLALDDPEKVEDALEQGVRGAADCDNPWLEATFNLVAGGLLLLSGRADASGQVLERALEASRRVGAARLETWSEVFGALARLAAGHDPSPVESLHTVAGNARLAGCPGAALVARVAEETAGGPPVTEAEHLDLSALDVEAWRRLALALTGGRDQPEVANRPPAIELRCFGALELRAGGLPVDLSGLQPKVRAVLLRLAVTPGRTVHRDRLLASVWPDSAGARGLQVAASSLRRFFAESGIDHLVAIVHRAEGYVLALEEGTADVVRFDLALARARLAKPTDPRGAAELHEALDLYRGDLLEFEGSSDWLIEERELRRRQAADAAEKLAWRSIEGGDWAGAQRAAVRGIEVDRYRDALWRALIEAYERAGQPAASAHAAAEYRSMLETLGVGLVDTSGPAQTRGLVH